jgi:hypothetical protein
VSNLMPRGEVSPVATKRAEYPLATEGAAYDAVKVDEQDSDGELELDWAFVPAASKATAAAVFI